MDKPQYAILRFAKYKGPEIGRIEAHDERTKEKYASNPDVDTSRSRLNFHLVKPRRPYRAEAEKQIAEAGCRARKDSVRVVETLITASPEFFANKKPREVKEFFEYALAFIQSKQSPETIVSAVVHMDEKTPHMHLCFVPLTEDGRLSAKDIIGNKKKLTQWQDEFWKHMVKKYPDFERGESASETGRTHFPPRLFKEAVRLNRQKDKIARLLSEITPLNAKKKSAEIETILDDYIPSVEKLMTRMKKAGSTVKELKKEIAALEQEVNSSKASVQRQLELARKVQELDDLRQTVEELQQALDAIPPEISPNTTIPNLKERKPLPLSNTKEVQAMQLPIQKLHPFENHPFQVKDDDEMNQLVWSVLTQGVLTPLVVRPLENDEYEVISGHRRLHACQKAGIETVPALIYALDRDAAAIALVDSNLHREKILPSERAFAYKMKAEALNHQGQRTDLTSAQVAPKLATEQIADSAGISKDTVKRFIRLTELIPQILSMVDAGKIALTPAVELSYLSQQEQQDLLETMESEDCTPSLPQAIQLKKLSQSGELSMDKIFEILREPKANQQEKISFRVDDLRKFFPKTYSAARIQERILKLLEADWRKRQRSQER